MERGLEQVGTAPQAQDQGLYPPSSLALSTPLPRKLSGDNRGKCTLDYQTLKAEARQHRRLTDSR